MEFHTLGERTKPLMILIHGMLTPWQIWQTAAEFFSDDYFVCIPTLDAHSQVRRSEFVSLSDEADKIIDFVISQGLKEVSVVCGISLGGAIAFEIYKRRCIKIDKLILDGAPLLPINKAAAWFMTEQYKSLIHKSQLRCRSVMKSFRKNFLPEKYLESYLNIADRMSDASIKNIIRSVCDDCFEGMDMMGDAQILFLYGTKGNELVSRRSAEKLSQLHPDVKQLCFTGCTHCYYASFQPEKWIHSVVPFIDDKM